MSAAASAPTLAPTGRLRVAVNLGNPVLVQRAADGALRGVVPALAAELARGLGVPWDAVPFEGAGFVTAALSQGVYDVVFLAVDPVRGEGIAFTQPYVLIEGGYAVRTEAPFDTVESVDAEGVRVAVAKGSAYDLYLTRALRHASLVRSATGREAVESFLGGGATVLAGVKQPLARVVAEHAGLRLLPGRFMSIEQAMGTPKTHGPAAHAALESFIAAQKQSGFVARALAESGQADAQVAP